MAKQQFKTHKERSDHFATTNEEDTMTDQSGADDTDINLIVKRYGIYGTAPGAARQPIYGDFTDVPVDLKDKINMIRSIPELQEQLPAELSDLTLHDLTQLSNQELEAKLKKPTAVPPDKPKDEQK